MDQTLKLKSDDFLKTLKTLEDALREKYSDYLRDSVIKRFEYTFEIAWKTGKVLLSHGFGIEVFSPKETFRELRKVKVLTDEEAELALEMTDDRNEIVHRYDFPFSKALYQRIKRKYFKLLIITKEKYSPFVSKKD